MKLQALVQFVAIFLIMASFNSCKKVKINASDYTTYPVYEVSDLGVNYNSEATQIKLWAPTASEVKFRLYQNDSIAEPLNIHLLDEDINGVWALTIKADVKNLYYTFQVKVGEKWMNEVPGPYARAVGANGKRGQIIDLSETNPQNWENETSPYLRSFADIVLYELHIRDFSIHPSSGIQNKGKYLAFTEQGTKSPAGNKTGIDHLAELGVTHVHILPAFDFRSIDETVPNNPKYNWGYDPQNYNVPEGSYATNARNGAVRINEFKQMVQALHSKGLRVVLDVVYNHVGNLDEQSFEQTVPGYYFRKNADGTLSNASGCGNETASERPMMQKYMIESLLYWVNEYHVDGFRFDLMGVHDINTMNLIASTLQKQNPTLFLYGEGWTAGESPLPIDQRAIKQNMPQIDGIAAFSDELRDGLKGKWNEPASKGFVSGNTEMAESVKFGIVAATQHPQIDYEKVNHSKSSWSIDPLQTINYVSCHDNKTLWDKLVLTNPNATEAERIRMAKLANMVVLTSQGVPFLHSGVEFLRTKLLVENSFESPDSINQINWSRKDNYISVFEFYKSLIVMRKEHPAFRMESADFISLNLEFLELEEGLVGYYFSGFANGDTWEEIVVVFNPLNKPMPFYLDEEPWTTVFDLDKGYHENGKKVKGDFQLDPISGYVFVK